MAHANISIFIPHSGCPNACSFCNQHTISRTAHAPTPEEAEDIIKNAFGHISSPEDRAQTEIAFFGGSFTAIEKDYMTALLETAGKYVRSDEHDGFRGIRISTRPDCIDEEILMLLKKHGVCAIELGAQSMNDRVLEMNMRGHTAEDVRRASAMIRSHGFELGLQVMVGLYGSSPEDEYSTMDAVNGCKPDTVRIYPVAVLEGTKLAELYREGKYTLYPFDEAIRICASMYRSFSSNGIRVIRTGLHAEDGVEQNSVAGFYHPAFGEIVRSEMIRQLICSKMSDITVCEANGRMMSALSGHKRSNRIFFADRNVSFLLNGDVPDECIRINGMDFNIYTD